jgi:hypothetical protein
MVGDLKIHYTCGGNNNDNDILDEAKQLWPRVGASASLERLQVFLFLGSQGNRDG